MLTLSFDGLDRSLDVKNPDGEVSTMTYDREGVDALAAGDDILIAGMNFSERGQVKVLARGNDVAKAYSCDDSSGNFR